MPSQADICNLALSRYLGERADIISISPLSETATTREREFAQFYPLALEKALEDFDFSFARTRAALSPVEYTPEAWLYAYVRPADCLKIRRVYDPQDTSIEGLYPALDYDQEALTTGQRVIVSNYSPLECLYTRNINDTSKFTPLFVTGFSCLLASYMAGTVIGGKAGIEAGAALEMQAMQVLGRAASVDNNQRQRTTQRNMALPRSSAVRFS